MLLYLTDTLIVDRSSPQFPNIRKAVKYIAMAVMESKHLLRGDYAVLEFMSDVFKDDVELFPVLHQLVVKYSTNTVPDEICRYVEVVLDENNDYEKNGHKIKKMPYSYFDDSMKVQAMTVVAEDEDDCALFDYMIRHYKRVNQLHYHYRFVPQRGGGSRTEATVKSCLKTGKMVTCITDSDQWFRGQPIDPHSTGKKCEKINGSGKIYYFLRLPVHEVENLIPLNHYNALDWSHDINKRDKDAFDKLCNNAHSELILPYFDIKEGIKQEFIHQLGLEMKNFAAKCCFCNPKIMKGKSFDEYLGDLEEGDLVYPRLRKRPMGELAPLYRGNSLPEPELMDFQYDAWNEIASLLLDVSCARSDESITV